MLLINTIYLDLEQMDLNTMRQIKPGDGPHRYTPRRFIRCSNTKSHLPRASNVVDPVEYLYVYTSTSQHFTASRTSPNSDRSFKPCRPETSHLRAVGSGAATISSTRNPHATFITPSLWRYHHPRGW
jgi:hypothetical protein